MTMILQMIWLFIFGSALIIDHYFFEEKGWYYLTNRFGKDKTFYVGVMGSLIIITGIGAYFDLNHFITKKMIKQAVTAKEVKGKRIYLFRGNGVEIE